MVANHVRLRAMDEVLRLQAVSRNYKGLKPSLEQSRKKGVIDGDGKILNYLFGVSTTDDLKKVNTRVDSLLTAIVKALWTHTTRLMRQCGKYEHIS